MSDLPHTDALTIREHEPLAAHTTLGLGGPARYFCDARSEDEVARALAWASERGLRVGVLGGGSNLLVPDAGWPGLVLRLDTRGIEARDAGEDGQEQRVHVRAAAGEPWDALVAWSVAQDLAGLECLSGIPGRVGATPIQNVGAYGQEVSDTILSVRALERATGEVQTLSPAQCQFAYRDSALKRDPELFVVLEVTFALTRGGAPAIRYAELERALGASPPSLTAVRETVLRLRRGKSMVIDAQTAPDDPNRRSAGSFFTNPIVSGELAAELLRRAELQGMSSEDVPRWAQPDGRVKLAAGWLIERSGFARGLRRGAVGLSSAHALALVHHGGGSCAELLALASEIVEGVEARFGVRLEREPVLW